MTLEATAAGAKEPATADPGGCVDHQGVVGQTRFRVSPVPGSRRRQVAVGPGDAPWQACDTEVIGGGLLCDDATGGTLAVPGPESVAVVTDTMSTLRERQRLAVLALDERCEEKWRNEWDAGRVAFSTVAANLVILAIGRDRPTEASPSELVAVRPETGEVAWRFAL